MQVGFLGIGLELFYNIKSFFKEHRHENDKWFQSVIFFVSVNFTQAMQIYRFYIMTGLLVLGQHKDKSWDVNQLEDVPLYYAYVINKKKCITVMSLVCIPVVYPKAFIWSSTHIHFCEGSSNNHINKVFKKIRIYSWSKNLSLR